jgi:sugar phosphate isomerase/epimerase
VDRWNGWMERYDLVPVCVDHFSDRRMWKNKDLSDDELFERSTWYIKTAAKLGAHTIRLLHDEHIGIEAFQRDYKLTDLKIAEKLLPVAAKYNVVMALECHAPTSVDDPIHQPYLDMAERMGLPFIGLQVDFSSYEYCISSADVGMYSRQGAHADILNFVREKERETYFAGRDFVYDEIKDKVEKMGPNEIDLSAIKFHIGFAKKHSIEKLKEYASRLVYAHGKFYDIDENGQVDNIDYPRVLKTLKEGGYKGYICSEFEGNRRMNDAGWVDEIDYIRRHQILMRKCLGYDK